MPHASFIPSIQANLERFENSHYQSDYDQVAVVLSMAKDLVDLLPAMFGPEKLSAWKTDEESTFDRFAALLFKCLQGLAAYLDQINPELLVESNVFQAKLEQVQKALIATQGTTHSLLAEGAPLFAQFEELLAQKEELEAIRKRKVQAETISTELSGLDLDTLHNTVTALEVENQRLQSEYQPLVERKTTLEAEAFQRRSAIDEITGLIDGLEKARPDEMMAYMENLTGWLSRLGSIETTFQDRAEVLHDDLQSELEKLRGAVGLFQENLEKSIAFSDMAHACQEEIEAQFSANRQIQDDFELSLVDRQVQLEGLSSDIKDQLIRYDSTLKVFLNQKDAADAKIKPLIF